jgi:hypothetical protein
MHSSLGDTSPTWRRLAVLLLVLALIQAGWDSAERPLQAAQAPAGAQPRPRIRPPRPPNIIFILADDLGYGELGCYGQKRIKRRTWIAWRGGDAVYAVLRKHNRCAPSRACPMTGLHTGHVAASAAMPPCHWEPTK